MLLKILAFLILCTVGGVFERMGGSSNYARQWRGVGVPICRSLILLLYWHPINWGWLWLLISFGAMIGAISSYHYFLPKPKDYTPVYYFLYGIINGIALLPIIWAGVHWYLIILSAMILGVVLGFWDKAMNRKILCLSSDVVQEFGRGFFIVLSRILI